MSFLSSCSFVFNGVNSEDFNVIIGWIDGSEPDLSVNGLNREIKKSTTSKVRLKDNIYGSENTDVITFTFNIVRVDGTEISRDESIRINQWLTSSPLPQLLKFNDEESCMLHYYAVCTEIKDITVDGCLLGKEIKFETNSPYAFMHDFEKTFKIDTDEKTIYFNNIADTYDGIYYPILTITTQSDNIIIENVTDKKSVTLDLTDINADSNGNKIVKINCEKLIIQDKDGKLIPLSTIGWNRDYKSYVSSIGEYITNIYWFRLLKGMNKIKITGNCTLKIKCEYPRKAGCM